MKIVQVQIKGISPLLQHRFSENAEAGKSTRAVHVKEETPREQAEKVVYRTDEGRFYFPGAAISRMLREAGGAHKQRGSRKSLKYIVPAAVIVPEEAIPIRNGNGKSFAKDFEVDSRPVTIPATKGRIMRHRPRFDDWSAKFALEIDDELLSGETIHQLLEEGGRRIGIGDYRPERGGPFGRFQVIEWKEQ